jgi:hypothetical protein
MQDLTVIYSSDRWSMMKNVATVMCSAKSINVGRKEIADLMLILETGYEMGLAPMESMHDLYVVNGRVCTFAEGTIKRVREHGWWIDYIEEDDDHVKAQFTKGKRCFIETFTMQDAIESGYTKNGIGWAKGAKRKMKLRYAVVQKAIKTRIPEVMGTATEIVELAQDAASDDFPKDEKQIKQAEVMDKLNEQAVTTNSPAQVEQALSEGKSIRDEKGNIIH